MWWRYMNNAIWLFMLSFMFHMLRLSLSLIMMMKVRPSWPSFEDRYILREIMLRRTKDINLLHCVALFLIHSIWEQVPNKTHWNSMIERTKTLIFVDFQSILKALGRTLLKHLEKRALKTQGRVSQMIILICGWQMNHQYWNPKG
jgi:hypothetical protein